jgi:glycosyltransferase involved in cell wall biosynthesis
LENPYDPRSWSGTPFHMRTALENAIERVSVLADLKPKRTLATAALRALCGGNPPRYPLFLTAPAQREFARQTLRTIGELKPDALLTISSHCVVRMRAPPLPAFMVTDAPWLSWKETYRGFDRMPLLGPRFARLEAAAAQRLTGLIFSSDWAVGEARRLYGVAREKLHSIPFGAAWTPDIDAAELHSIIAQRPIDRVALLFVGKDWVRKGGPLALEIARALAQSGTPVKLHIVGCTPAIAPGDQSLVRVHGFLNVRVPDESARLKHLFLHSHFLVVPTRAECFGVVFAEAQAFGLPPVSRAVQAVPSIVIDGTTGILQPPDASAASYGQRILALLRDRKQYRAMAHAARERYQATLTWERFAATAAETMERAIV